MVDGMIGIKKCGGEQKLLSQHTSLTIGRLPIRLCIVCHFVLPLSLVASKFSCSEEGAYCQTSQSFTSLPVSIVGVGEQLPNAGASPTRRAVMASGSPLPHTRFTPHSPNISVRHLRTQSRAATAGLDDGCQEKASGTSVLGVTICF